MNPISNESSTYHCGLPGQWISKWFLNDNTNKYEDIYTCKVSGYPIWYHHQVKPSNIKPIRCNVCNSYMLLVTQIYAPLYNFFQNIVLYMFLFVLIL